MENKTKFAKVIQITRIFFGCSLSLFGILGILVGIIAIIDPIGSKMSDDNDPLGIPPTFVESLAITSFYVLIFILGLGLILGSKWIGEKIAKIRLG